MALGQKRNVAVVPGARQALEQFKYEVANEIAQGGDPQAQTLQSWYQTGYGGNIPARVWGAVGGNMVRRMIAAAEQTLAQQAVSQVRAGFQQGLQQGGREATEFQFGQQSGLQGQFQSAALTNTPDARQVHVPPAN